MLPWPHSWFISRTMLSTYQRWRVVTHVRHGESRLINSRVFISPSGGKFRANYLKCRAVDLTEECRGGPVLYSGPYPEVDAVPSCHALSGGVFNLQNIYYSLAPRGVTDTPPPWIRPCYYSHLCQVLSTVWPIFSTWSIRLIIERLWFFVPANSYLFWVSAMGF